MAKGVVGRQPLTTVMATTNDQKLVRARIAKDEGIGRLRELDGQPQLEALVVGISPRSRTRARRFSNQLHLSTG
jgi:hypothetical protein